MTFPFSATRRRLLFFAASFASTFGTAIAAFGQQSNNSIKQAKPRTDGFEPVVGPTSILDEHGKVLTDKVLIVKNSANNKLVAVSPLCAHRNCVVDWKQEKQRFVCPCHGSEFATDGKVVKGPAERGLKPFETKIENNRFLVKPL
ncbi:Rieske (2Fe-2S) protein [Tolypothrix sp. PCC 7910]|uniref:QcrA and Rieske domain-containing protein n=1 Tax=Tolypothrix sp. PCC 7910 TaxID=2099387 RepID=UPI0014279EDD|nr:Rieske (2Fe-2S) protein [Tolypothrix sp. PCC 7910]QIR35991.1 Rieske (2Fe-2S) protein [Tolypothrix sp. PCC 7910]